MVCQKSIRLRFDLFVYCTSNWNVVSGDDDNNDSDKNKLLLLFWPFEGRLMKSFEKVNLVLNFYSFVEL